MDDLEEENRDDVTHLEYGERKAYFTMIAPCFENLSTLRVLDLSRTNIQSLPRSISVLSLLVNLTLQECSMLMELPAEIGKLQNLMTFDLEGTEIMYLPKEMGKLENLQCLRVSFCAYADEYIVCNGIENIIPRTMISKFRKLKELSVFVNPDAKWWEVEVIEAILEHLPFLTCLQTLKLYLPTAKELQYFLNCHAIYSNLLDFRLKIGHGEPLTSYLKTKLVDSFEKLEKCLKYENGEGSSDDIEGLVRHAKALFIFRHWTIEKLSIFDVSKLSFCLLAECNEMQTVIDADDFHGDKAITIDNDGNDAFECLKYLAIHSMKKLQSIWKGPIARNSFSCLQVLALHTCPDLTTVFTEDMLDKLHNLTVVMVEDCPKVNSLVSRRSAHGHSFLPNLRKILLLDLPELVSLSSGVFITPRLDTLLVFNCLKLDYLSHDELSRYVKEIKGETEWWDALKNKDEYSRAFVPLKRDGNLMNQLAEDTNSLKEFHKLQGRGGASTMSSSTFVPPDSQTKKHLDWGMFIEYLKYRQPPVPLVQCNSGHVVDFLKYLNRFGDIRLHVKCCVLFGHPNPDVTCFCPRSEAWGTLEAIATRLHTAYEENRLLDMKPFPIRDIESYLKEVRKSQENALGMPVEDESDFGWRHKKSSLKQEMISSGHESKSRDKRKYIEETISEDFSEYKRILSEPGSKSAGKRSEASKKLQDHVPILDVSFSDMSSILDEFRIILKGDDVKSREHSLSVNPHSSETTTHGSSSIHQVQDDEYEKSNTISPGAISRLRHIAVRARSDGCMPQCVEIYTAERKTMIQSSFLQFNIAKWNADVVSGLDWIMLESLIEVWIKSVKISIEHLFASEKQLCEKIFQGLVTDIEDICFEVIIQIHQIQAFNIIYTLSVTNPPPDKLFIILDLYETLDHFLNKMCFFAKPRDPFQATVHTQLFVVLSDKITSSLSIFETVLIYHESSVVFVGPIDPLPRYVMSYLHQLCEHKHTLRNLSLPKLPTTSKDDLSLYSEELKGQNALSRHVIWIIMMMVTNLEGKAKLCEDGSAGYFFAMKNIGYIVHSIEGHRDLMEVVGDGYYGKLIQKLDYAKVRYLKLELEKIIEMRDFGVE